MSKAARIARQVPLTVPANLLPSDQSLVKHLEKSKPAQVSTLSNGFRVATKETGGQTSTVGIWIDAGSRYETWENNGVAHYLEHMTFKGTTTRSKTDIDTYFEFTGGHLNAYTTREQTVYFVQAFNKNVPDALDRLTDILRRPRLLEQDVESERHTILTEKEDVETNVDEVMMDNVHLTCFPNDGLGMTILGLVENIQRNIGVPMIQEYIRQHYTAKRMVLVGCGGISHESLTALAEKYWGDLPSYPAKPEVNAKFHGGECVVEYDLPTPNLSVAWGICGQSSHDMLLAQILQFYLGSWDRHAEDLNRTSLLHEISDSFDTRGSAGRVESLQAFTTPYSDVSLFGVYMVCSPNEDGSPKNFNQFQLEVVRRLLQAMECMTPDTLHTAKELYKASCLLQIDGTTVMADYLGAQMLSHGRDVPLTELYGRVDAIGIEDLRDFIQKYIFEKPYVLTGVGPRELLPQGGPFKDRLWMKDAEYQAAAYGM